jgi:sugar/nucleoside kinase (ribokinase family)
LLPDTAKETIIANVKHQDTPRVYGIGNPLIDIIVSAEDQDLVKLGIHKGTMTLIGKERHAELLSFAKTKHPAYSCGGSCPNTIITLALLGVNATLAGKVGNDENGDIYNAKLNDLNLGNELARTDKQPTGSTVILVTPDSERSMNTFLGANRLYSRNDINPQTVKDADFFHFTGYMWDTQSQQDAIMCALDIAKKNGTIVTFDIADPFAVGRYREKFLGLITDYCDIVFANSEEARILFDNYDPYECCRSMGKLCRTAIVKNGKKGSFICHDKKILKIPAKGAASPVDTTGAGDTYAAGYIYGLCTNHSIEESGMIASILAGEIIGQYGAQFSTEKAHALRMELESGDWENR